MRLKVCTNYLLWTSFIFVIVNSSTPATVRHHPKENESWPNKIKRLIWKPIFSNLRE